MSAVYQHRANLNNIRESALNLGNEGFFEYGTEGVLERMVLATADERRLVIRCEGREQVTHAPLDTWSMILWGGWFFYHPVDDLKQCLQVKRLAQ